MAAKDLKGRRFGRLVALDSVGTNRHRCAIWRVRCDCGKAFETLGTSLLSGNTTSCGCARAKHDRRFRAERKVWREMVRRCENPKDLAYPHYGGRGIRVCERWRQSFEAFLEDMGPRPPRMTLERQDSDGHYEPSNVRWATWKEQQRNRRNNHLVEVDGVKATIAEWSERTGIGPSTIWARLKSGWSGSRAVTAPVRRSGGRGPASLSAADTISTST